ncbi:hypothetical protein [Massilia rubra]|uniref:Uncharacterized protein n=1 Tax=Massilia rubra TaxID=2607910 RepID=A0ABX0LUI9_9BURK|nr:hypothetical protein [Massilia rubra]NHZ38345.1 hypothetical protein [Massilia rubra]
MNEQTEARDVILALRSYSERIDEIMTAIADRRSITSQEKDELQSKLVMLKADIKAAAKRKKVRDNRDPQTSTERAYFEPALRGASANFRVATNSHPITSRWHSCLYDVNIDFSYFLHQLEKQYPDVQ